MKKQSYALATLAVFAVGAVLLLAAPARGQTTLYTFNGDSAGDLLGYSVSGAGDVNGDGFADLIVGAIGDDNNGSFSGSARVFSGKDGSILHTFNGDSAGDLFGISVSGAGDVDGDSFADLIVGVRGDDNNGDDSGSARVLSGEWITATSLGMTPLTQEVIWTFDGDSAGDEFGVSVSGAGDVNCDGFADLIVGAWHDDNNGDDSGSARVFSGKTGLPLCTFNGDSAGDVFGFSVSGAGDVNADGFDDLIVGGYADNSNGTSSSGYARVFSGKTSLPLYTFNGDSAGDRFGFAVSGAGDVNADGFADLIVGAELDDNTACNSGSARVFSGKTGLPLYTFNGDSAGDQFGRSVSGAGDVDGDGFADLIVGANRAGNNGATSGSARVFSGFNGSVLFTLDGDSAGDNFGWSVSGAGDVDGDGVADLVVGAFVDDNNGSNSGSARVFAGSADSDGDGVNDADDACPDSDPGLTIVIGGVDTGVDNEPLGDGCTIADLIDAILAADPSTGDVVQFLVDLRAEGIITAQDLGAILKALNSP